MIVGIFRGNMAIRSLCDCCDFSGFSRSEDVDVSIRRRERDLSEDETMVNVALVVSHLFLVSVSLTVAPTYFAAAFAAGSVYGLCVPKNPSDSSSQGGSLFQKVSNIHFHPALDVAIATLASAEHMVHHVHHTTSPFLRTLSHLNLSVLLNGFCTGAQLSRLLFCRSAAEEETPQRSPSSAIRLLHGVQPQRTDPLQDPILGVID